MRCPRRGINDFVGEMGLKKMPLVIVERMEWKTINIMSKTVED